MNLIDSLLEEQEPFAGEKPYSWTFVGSTENQKKTPANERDLVNVLKGLNPTEFDGIRIFNRKFNAASTNILFGKVGTKNVFMVARSEGRSVGSDGVWAEQIDSAVLMAISQIA